MVKLWQQAFRWNLESLCPHPSPTPSLHAGGGWLSGRLRLLQLPCTPCPIIYHHLHILPMPRPPALCLFLRCLPHLYTHHTAIAFYPLPHPSFALPTTTFSATLPAFATYRNRHNKRAALVVAVSINSMATNGSAIIGVGGN